MWCSGWNIVSSTFLPSSFSSLPFFINSASSSKES